MAIPVIQRVVAILWPSFITAGIATLLLAAVFDLTVLFIEYNISQLGSYSLSFFILWLFGIVTAMTTCYFLNPCEAINKAKAEAAKKAASNV